MAAEDDKAARKVLFSRCLRRGRSRREEGFGRSRHGGRSEAFGTGRSGLLPARRVDKSVFGPRRYEIVMEYSVSEIAAICQGTFCGEDVTVRSVVADSRRSVATDGATLFVAIRGRNHDGHDYIADLYRRGVRGFMVEREVDARDYPGAGFVRVDKSPGPATRPAICQIGRASCRERVLPPV